MVLYITLEQIEKRSLKADTVKASQKMLIRDLGFILDEEYFTDLAVDNALQEVKDTAGARSSIYYSCIEYMKSKY